jgi:transposase-like protein
MAKKYSFEFKIFVIEQINNGQILLIFATEKYCISRGTFDYWRKKLNNYSSKKNGTFAVQKNGRNMLQKKRSKNTSINQKKGLRISGQDKFILTKILYLCSC